MAGVSQGSFLKRKERIMKVLAINASPKAEKSNTSLILNPFLQGLRSAGAEVDLFYTQKLKVRPCAGDLHCWFQKPGECIHQDDMATLYPKWRSADIWVLASPVYFDGVSGPLKNMMDRLVPLIEPFIELRDGHCRHTLRAGTQTGKIVLIANCGFWETDNFDPLIRHMQAFAKTIGREFAGSLIRPSGESFKGMLELNLPVEDIQQAAEQAGRQLIALGDMPAQTLKTISREILPLEKFVKATNRIVRQMLEQNGHTPKGAA
jgi:multimeric flavodoxin WrbA